MAKINFKTIAVLIGLVLITQFSSFIVKAQNKDLTKVLNNMEIAAKKLIGLQATISHQKTNAQLNIKDIKQVGTLIYKPGAIRRVRIDYVSPQHKIMAVNGDKAILLETDLNQAFVTTVKGFATKNNSYGLLTVLNSTSQLKTIYNCNLVGNENFNGQVTSHLTLFPKTANGYAKIEAWIDNQTWLPVRQIFYERNNDYTEVVLSNLVLNPPITNKQFEVNLGKVKIIKG